VRWLVITGPAGFDEFVRAIAQPAESNELPPPGRPVDLRALAEAAAHVGIEVLGPRDAPGWKLDTLAPISERSPT
jgi:hypothetical protein